jgi:hypothetical protein
MQSTSMLKGIGWGLALAMAKRRTSLTALQLATGSAELRSHSSASEDPIKLGIGRDHALHHGPETTHRIKPIGGRLHRGRHSPMGS